MKNILDILKTNNSGIGFNSNSNRSNEKLLVFGITDDIKDELNFNCDAFIYKTFTKKKSSNFTGKIISKGDKIDKINNFDFIVINTTSDVDFNIFNYENGIGLFINEKINEERQNTIESFDFDFLIYDFSINSYNNLEEIFKIKDIIGTIHNNWIININTENFDLEHLQYIYDLGFLGIVLNLSTMNKKSFKSFKTKIAKLEDRKNDKL